MLPEGMRILIFAQETEGKYPARDVGRDIKRAHQVMVSLLKEGFTPYCLILNFNHLWTGRIAYLPLHVFTLDHFERKFKLGVEGNPR